VSLIAGYGWMPIYSQPKSKIMGLFGFMKRRRQPETSQKAYESQTPVKVRKEYQHIAKAILTLDGATYDQVAMFYQLSDPNAVSRRLGEMVDNGMIYRTNEKRLTRRNRQAYVYRIKTV